MSLTQGKLAKDPNPPLTPKKYSRNGDSNSKLKCKEKYNLRITNASLKGPKKSLMTPQIERTDNKHFKRNMTARKLSSVQHLESLGNASTKLSTADIHD